MQIPVKPRGNSLREEELKNELSDLKKVVLQKLDNDTTLTADAFAEGENIFRSLRVAYSFKTVLDTVNNTFTIFGLPGEVSDIAKAKSLTEAATNSAFTAASVLLLWENLKEDSGKLSMVFNSKQYVENVRQMLKEAGSNQPIIGFDKDLYRQGIKFQLASSRGQEIINVHHIRPQNPCRIIEPRGPLVSTPPTLNGVAEVSHYLLSVFQKLEIAIDKGEISDFKANQLIVLVRQVKTGMLQSRLAATEFGLSLPPSSECAPESTKVTLGRVAERQQLLGHAFEAIDKKLTVEQAGTLKTAGNAMLSAVTIYLKDGSQIKEVLKAGQKVSLSYDLGDIINKKFEKKVADPGELIGELPQEMLMAMPQESSETVLAIDTLDLCIRQYLSPLSGPPIKVPPATSPNIPTLFLFDVSGSMNDNDKIGQARAAGLDALKEMKEAGSPPTSIMTFSGNQCGGNVTKKLLGFTTDLTLAENTIRTHLPVPSDGTPIPQARDAAIANISAYLDSNSNLKEGRIILLSDGQSTCPPQIRPSGVFSRRTDIGIKKNPFSRIRFFTIGFDMEAGSAAERDLQFLASETGGKYYNAADRDQLTRALRKQVRRYLPRACNSSDPDFASGLRAFSEYNYAMAADAFRRYTSANQRDWCGFYNLGLAYEASDHYKKAAENYQKYLVAAPTSPDRAKIEAKIAEMNEEYVVQFDYYTRLIASDLGYLNGFYKTVFNRSSRDLAAEFDGFVYEKRGFYANLSDTLEIDQRWLSIDSKDISSSLEILAKRRNLESFDRDAVSLLTTPIGQIEDMLDRLRDYRIKSIR